MPKGKILEANDAKISNAVKKTNKRKVIKKKKKMMVEWSSLFRISLMLFFVGVIVFHYYLITENALLSYYQLFWIQNKVVLAPVLSIVGYTLTVFLLGFWVGKRRK